MDDPRLGQTTTKLTDRRGPTLLGLVFLAVLALVVGLAAARATGGHLTYAQDDAYIHMAMAKNIAAHGVWGVHADRFTSSSSSPLWTALLAVMFTVAGVHDTIPLMLNLVCAFASVILVGTVLRDQRTSPASSVALLLLFVATVPLVPLVWVGMEASLQVWLTILCAWRCQRVIERPDASPRAVVVLLAAAALLVATRYEGLFVLAGCALALTLNGRTRLAGLVLLAGATPVVGVGLWNWSHGWFFLPVSIVMKRSLFLRIGDGSFATSLADSLRTLRMPAALPLLMLAAGSALAVFARAAERRRRLPAGVLIFLTAAVLHTLAGRFGVFYRYEGYLVALGLFAMIPTLDHLLAVVNGQARAGTREGVLVATTVAAGCALLLYGLSGTLVTPLAMRNIYEQQRQMAGFIAAYYDGREVAMNDIGAASYFSNADVLDLSGLGSLAVARLRMTAAAPRSFQELADQTGHPDVAVIYERWFAPETNPASPWRRVATWTIADNIVCGDATVSFFAKASAAPALVQRLREFAPRLPPGVVVHNDPDL